MPELKRTFSGGAMNKDLDERLVPNGQYRDALNVQVSTSEGADVGALQNILGNKLPYANSIASNLGNNPYVVGSIRRDETECIYWFVESATKSLIIEFNQVSKTVEPVLVDENRILKFSKNYLITGIDILDDFLIWTDDQSEPKMIKITDWKNYTNNTWTHTQVNGADFEEKHCTVIKEGPLSPPTLKMAKTTRTGPLEATLNGRAFTYLDNTGRWKPIPTGEYTDQNGDGVADGALNPPAPNPADSQIKFSSTAPDFRVGDKLKITALNEDGEEIDENVFVVASVEETYQRDPKLFKINIDVVDTNIEQGVTNWRVQLIQKPAMFETKFVRFAYRYKYKDGEYSVISPFSEVAFIGDQFDYDHKKGYNLGMVNQLRLLEIRDWAENVPFGVDEVDILYKDSVSNNIYIVKSIKTTDSEYSDNGTFLDPYTGRLEITSELIYKVIPSNQILRPYDNVPRKAKALSISGNRLLFGNYVENYNMTSDNKEITVKFAVNVTSLEYPVITPIASLKSLRTYQIGVVYRDKYGRETPVFTDSTGSIKLNKGFSVSRNHIRVRITSPIPDWVHTFKYYIRETSQPYYNLAMDRHYPAEDGNVWISFSSSERNKIQDDTFLILKKAHDSDAFIKEEAKYKVLAVENEAPDFIKEELVSKGTLFPTVGNIFASNTGYPLSASDFVEIEAGLWQSVFGGGSVNLVAAATPVHQLNDLTVVIFSDKNKTKHYDIANIQLLTARDPQVYRVNLEKPLSSEDVSFVPQYNSSDTTLSLEIFQRTVKRKPEFKGRFFTKIQRDTVLDSYIVPKQNKTEYRVTQVEPAGVAGLPNRTGEDGNFWTSKKAPQGWYFCYYKYHDHYPSQGASFGQFPNNYRGGIVESDDAMNFTPGWGAMKGYDIIEIAYHGFGDGTTERFDIQQWQNFGRPGTDTSQHGDFVRAISTPGTRFRFSDDPDKLENIYTIRNYAVTPIIAYPGPGKKHGRYASSRVIKWTLKLDRVIEWSPEQNIGSITIGGSTITSYKPTNIEILQTFSEDAGFTSENPGIFETEPKEVAELDIYYEASRAYSTTDHGSTQRLFYSNCYSFGNGVESDRIRDDFNAPIIGKGVRVSTVLEEQYKEVRKKSDIIYSGIYNSTSGINNLNQFIQAEQITKSINPSYGSIQLMQFRLGDLDVYLEDNVVKILADRDALFNADGSKNVVASTNVLGSIQPYAGDYGISKNPESYSRYGNRAYFSDKNRGVVLRLSGNGLTPISDYGMEDYFRDKLAVSGIKVIGSYDENKDEYNLTFTGDPFDETINLATYNETVSFKESINGWNTRKSFIQESGLSLNNIYYTFKKGELWSHDNEIRNNFYGTQYNSSVKFIYNDAPGSVKSFKTLNYEGSQARVFVDDPDTDNKFSNRLAKAGWWVSSIESDLQSGQVKTFKNKEGKWFYNILGTETTLANLDTREYSVQGLGYVSAITGEQGQDIELVIE